MIRRPMMFAVLVAVGVLAFGCGNPAPASTQVQARAIEGQVWSPYCPGRLLSDCTTRQAFELRGTIEERLHDGESPEQVLTWLQANYGDEILARPAANLSGLMIWSIPLLIFAAGAVAVTLAVRRWSGTPAPDQDPPTGGDRWVSDVRDEVRRDL